MCVDSRQFRHNIRNYNNSLSFCSLGIKYQDRSVYGPRGVRTFRIRGELCHEIGGLLPKEDHNPAFAQIYVYEPDPNRQVDLRLKSHHGRLDRATVRSLQDMLYRSGNPFITAFHTAGERLRADEHISLKLNCITAPPLDQRRYNHP